MGRVYDKLESFKGKYPRTLAFRLRKHAQVAEDSLAKGEKVQYAFCGLKGFGTNAVVVTDKRVIVAHKRLLFGHYCESITKDKICNMNEHKGVVWSRITFETLPHDYIEIDNIDPEATEEIKEHYVKDIISPKVVERSPRVHTTSMSSSSRSKQMEQLIKLDDLYKEKYSRAKTEKERLELRIKMIRNYNRYLELLKEEDEQLIEAPYKLSLRK